VVRVTVASSAGLTPCTILFTVEGYGLSGGPLRQFSDRSRRNVTLGAHMYSNILSHEEACRAMPAVQNRVQAGDANSSQEHSTRNTAHHATDAKGLRQRFGVGAAEEARYRRNVALNINDQAAADHWDKVGEALRTQRFGSCGDIEGRTALLFP
jgi:hypothetical protein